MKISEQWLREFVNPRVTAGGLAKRLTLAGIEISSVTDALPPIDKVVVGEVLKVARHPQADKLSICDVRIGVGKPLQIVCGAPNVRTGMKAPVVLPGGRLPNGTEIQVSPLRGVESQGMLCSARELGIADDHSGLLELPADSAVGEPLVQILGGADKILEVEITPNRGDCLSMLGIARELGALFDLDLKLPPCAPVRPAIKDTLPVNLAAPEACPVFAGRIIRGLRTDAVTPLWMRERLRRAGLRCVHPVVDVTQYVMLELGQPMHAYDLKRLSGGIVVRMARAGESLQLLDGNTHTLEPDMLVIADSKRPLGVGGIMGGAASSVQADTSDIYLEAAFFSPQTIGSRERKLGVQTDAAYRFARGVDPAGQTRALERATRLLLNFAGGKPGPVHRVAGRKNAAAKLALRQLKLRQLLGIKVPEREVGRILTRLGFRTRKRAHTWEVRAPSHRFDIEREEDLVEEVGRVFGYDRIPAIVYPSTQRMLPLPEEQLPLARLRDILTGRGYQEVITYSFVDGPLQQRLTGGPGIALANPITADMTEMRCSLWPGLVQTLRYNLNRQQKRARIFECGMRFLTQHSEITQENVLSGLITGPQYPVQWGLPQRVADLADLRGDVEALLMAGGVARHLEASAAPHPALHPGQSAKLRLNGVDLGWMGALHPILLRELTLDQPVFLFELRLEPLLHGRLSKLAPISPFPSLSRDLAVVVDEGVAAGTILRLVRETAGPQAIEVHIFDIYYGPGIDSGRKSVALSLILQDSSRTLTDEAADATVKQVVRQLQDKLGATIRD
ncbi:MAG TPA: phenylalanine--tRNA ligase subunit beta [Gammaproteobacteria bacterium]|nr:phenylalanine--tRNA ligase subunit beta [Gammaproteobacteria bacterium]